MLSEKLQERSWLTQPSRVFVVPQLFEAYQRHQSSLHPSYHLKVDWTCCFCHRVPSDTYTSSWQPKKGEHCPTCLVHPTSSTVQSNTDDSQKFRKRSRCHYEKTRLPIQPGTTKTFPLCENHVRRLRTFFTVVLEPNIHTFSVLSETLPDFLKSKLC